MNSFRITLFCESPKVHNILVIFLQSQLIYCNEADSLRLSNASDYFVEENRTGRVEICDCSISSLGCQWMTITVPTGSVAWGWKNAQVACRELYPEDYGVMNPILQDKYAAH